MNSLFGTDGVRGRFGEEPITPQTILKLGWAVGCVLGRDAGDAEKPHVLIGKDTRVSGYLLESALQAGLVAAGMDVTLLGPMPTPAIAYLTRTARAAAGIVISASHNPHYDNGIKIFSPDGAKLSRRVLAQIEEKMQAPLRCVASDALGKAVRMDDAPGRYIEFCKRTFPESLSLSGLNIVVDCANGAAYEIAPRVLEELGGNVSVIANQPDGFNINADCGSTHWRRLAARVKAESADIGMALDGDADRVLFVDAAGALVDGDQALFILARQRRQRKTLQGGVVGTQMSNVGLQLALNALGVEFARAQVGDSYVHEQLLARGWQLGGEASGHTICLDKSPTGDGLIAALELLQAMLESGKPLRELAAGMTRYPQEIVNVQCAAGDAALKRADVARDVARAEKTLGARGRVLLRASGTEPLVRVMVEGEDAGKVAALARELAATVAAAN